MKKFLFVVLCLILGGCGSVPESQEPELLEQPEKPHALIYGVKDNRLEGPEEVEILRDSSTHKGKISIQFLGIVPTEWQDEFVGFAYQEKLYFAKAEHNGFGASASREWIVDLQEQIPWRPTESHKDKLVKYLPAMTLTYTQAPGTSYPFKSQDYPSIAMELKARGQFGILRNWQVKKDWVSMSRTGSKMHDFTTWPTKVKLVNGKVLYVFNARKSMSKSQYYTIFNWTAVRPDIAVPAWPGQIGEIYMSGTLASDGKMYYNPAWRYVAGEKAQRIIF